MCTEVLLSCIGTFATQGFRLVRKQARFMDLVTPEKSVNLKFES